MARCVTSPENSRVTCKIFCLTPSDFTSDSINFASGSGALVIQWRRKIVLLLSSYVPTQHYKSHVYHILHQAKAHITGEDESASLPSLLWLCGRLSCFFFLNPPPDWPEAHALPRPGTSAWFHKVPPPWTPPLAQSLLFLMLSAQLLFQILPSCFRRWPNLWGYVSRVATQERNKQQQQQQQGKGNKRTKRYWNNGEIKYGSWNGTLHVFILGC